MAVALLVFFHHLLQSCVERRLPALNYRVSWSTINCQSIIVHQCGEIVRNVLFDELYKSGALTASLLPGRPRTGINGGYKGLVDVVSQENALQLHSLHELVVTS
jgi:hypothetical protein